MRKTIGHVFGYTALTLLLTAGAAQSLSGSNTVFGDDIVDGTITTPDLKTGALSGSKILDDSVTEADIKDLVWLQVFNTLPFGWCARDAQGIVHFSGTIPYDVVLPAVCRPAASVQFVAPSTVGGSTTVQIITILSNGAQGGTSTPWQGDGVTFRGA